uniref:Reverse transcriptase Ty1/copia-type domain-containing protein n=1 Tax=Tanacetum cinerariifolium TaxID=118510 RepID=A0A6L2MF17_TANCI|nr:hypothetical protein [Tanacetum cinerariifolium]
MYKTDENVRNQKKSLVVKPVTIQTVLSLALSRSLPIHQLDVKNAFFNGDLSETIYMSHRVLWILGFHIMYTGYRDHYMVAYLLIYVDDIILTASSTTLLQRIISSLHPEFDMTDLGALNYFLRNFVARDSTSMFLSQRKYVMGLFEWEHMANCNSTRTPVDTPPKMDLTRILSLTPTLYRSLAEPHLEALKRILRYIRGTLDFAIRLYFSSSPSLIAYTDVEWAGCPTTRRSTSGGVANVVVETTWIRNLLRGLYSPICSATIVDSDNVSAIYLTANPVQHQWTKHIDIDIHFVCDMVTRGQVRVFHAPSRQGC